MLTDPLTSPLASSAAPSCRARSACKSTDSRPRVLTAAMPICCATYGRTAPRSKSLSVSRAAPANGAAVRSALTTMPSVAGFPRPGPITRACTSPVAGGSSPEIE